MTKTVSTSKKPRKQHSPEFRSEALKLAERIGVAAAARELNLYGVSLNIENYCTLRLFVSVQVSVNRPP
ncbi:hypothetical protein ACI6NN_004868, partial [Escherichia coli]